MYIRGVISSPLVLIFYSVSFRKKYAYVAGFEKKREKQACHIIISPLKETYFLHIQYFNAIFKCNIMQIILYKLCNIYAIFKCNLWRHLKEKKLLLNMDSVYSFSNSIISVSRNSLRYELCTKLIVLYEDETRYDDINTEESLNMHKGKLLPILLLNIQQTKVFTNSTFKLLFTFIYKLLINFTFNILRIRKL